MNKKGFVFLETIVALVVVTVALTAFLRTYTLISTQAKQREFYDNTSDKYLLYAIANIGVTGQNTIPNVCGNGFYVTKDNVYKLNENKTAENCLFKSPATNPTKGFYSNLTELEKIMNSANLLYLYYVPDLADALNNANKPTYYFDNGTLEYLRTLSVLSGNRYFVGVFKRSGRYYFASINL